MIFESGTETEFEVALLVQESDEILDPAETALIEITVESELEPVRDGVNGEIVIVFLRNPGDICAV